MAWRSKAGEEAPSVEDARPREHRAPKPDLELDGVPRCRTACPNHDGRVCRILGWQPEGLCEPEIRRWRDELVRLRRKVEKKCGPRMTRAEAASEAGKASAALARLAGRRPGEGGHRFTPEEARAAAKKSAASRRLKAAREAAKERACRDARRRDEEGREKGAA